MTIYAQEVRKGETVYMDDDGNVKLLLIELDMPIMTLPDHTDKEIRIVMPTHKNEVPKIYAYNLDTKEQEKAFDILDIALHSETYKDLDEQVSRQANEIEELKAKIAYLEGECDDAYVEVL